MSTILGIVSGVGLLVYAMLGATSLEVFIDYPSIMMVGGGVLAATFISFPLPRVFKVFGVLMTAFRKEIREPSSYIAMVVRLAAKARKEGLMSLQEDVKRVNNRFLRLGVELAVDGHPPEMVRDVLETELEGLILRHQEGSYIFRTMAKFSPAFGLIGTLVGLIAMLKSIGGKGGLEALGPAMALALITTFYGSILANMLFLPIAEKLSSRSETEVLQIRIMIEGVILIQEGTNPRLIQQKLNAFLSPELRSQHYERLLAQQRGAAAQRA